MADRKRGSQFPGSPENEPNPEDATGASASGSPAPAPASGSAGKRKPQAKGKAGVSGSASGSKSKPTRSAKKPANPPVSPTADGQEVKDKAASESEPIAEPAPVPDVEDSVAVPEIAESVEAADVSNEAEEGSYPSAEDDLAVEGEADPEIVAPATEPESEVESESAVSPETQELAETVVAKLDAEEDASLKSLNVAPPLPEKPADDAIVAAPDLAELPATEEEAASAEAPVLPHEAQQAEKENVPAPDDAGAAAEDDAQQLADAVKAKLAAEESASLESLNVAPPLDKAEEKASADLRAVLEEGWLKAEAEVVPEPASNPEPQPQPAIEAATTSERPPEIPAPAFAQDKGEVKDQGSSTNTTRDTDKAAGKTKEVHDEIVFDVIDGSRKGSLKLMFGWALMGLGTTIMVVPAMVGLPMLIAGAMYVAPNDPLFIQLMERIRARQGNGARRTPSTENTASAASASAAAAGPGSGNSGTKGPQATSTATAPGVASTDASSVSKAKPSDSITTLPTQPQPARKARTPSAFALRFAADLARRFPRTSAPSAPPAQ